MRYTVYGVGSSAIAWIIAIPIVIIFQCNPVAFFWNQNIPGGKCIDTNSFYFASGVLSSITLVTVLLLPLPIVARLKITMAKKLGLAGSFSLGAL